MSDLYGDKGAVKQVAENARKGFVRAALAAAEALAKKQDTFTSLDVRDGMVPDQGTHDYRALGAVMRSLPGLDIAVQTESYTKSKQRRNHNRPVRVWRSLLR